MQLDSNPQSTRTRKVLLIGVGIALATFAVEAPLRYALTLIHAESILYLRDALFLAPLTYQILSAAAAKAPSIPTLTFLFLIFLTCAGLVQLDDPRRVAFGFKIFLPFLAGLTIWSWLGAAPGDKLWPFALPFLLVIAAGLGIDFATEPPWTGLTYSVMGVQVEANRFWWTGGFQRLSGFSRASFEAGGQALLCGLVLACYLPKAWMRMAAWLVAGGAILATTTKGLISAYFFCTLLMALITSSRGRTPAKVLLMLSLCGTALMPFLGLQPWLNVRTGWSATLLSSFIDRLINTWPQALDLYAGYNWVIGGGLGAIGVPQLFFDRTHYNPADNLFVYLLNVMGLIAVVIWAAIAHSLLKLRLEHRESRLTFLIGAGIFTAGLTMNMLESAWLAFGFGAFMGALTSPSFTQRPITYPMTLSGIIRSAS